MSTRDNRGNAPLVILVVILAVAALGFAGIAYWQSMNGTKEAAALKDQLEAEQGEKAELEGKMADLESEKAAKEREAEEAKKLAEDKAKEVEAAKLAALTAPETWATSTIKDLGVAFSYPKEWGAVQLQSDGLTGEAGTGGYLGFSKLGRQVAMWVTPGFKSDGSGTPLYWMLISDKTSCDRIVAGEDAKVESCESVTIGGKTLTTFLYSYKTVNQGRGTSTDESRYVGYVTTGNQTYPTLAAAVPTATTLDTLKKFLFSVK